MKTPKISIFATVLFDEKKGIFIQTGDVEQCFKSFDFFQKNPNDNMVIVDENNKNLNNEIVKHLISSKRNIIIIGCLEKENRYQEIFNHCDEICLSVKTVSSSHKQKGSFPLIKPNFQLKENGKCDDFTCLLYQKDSSFDKGKNVDNVYNDVVREVLINGLERTDRTSVGTVSLFGKRMVFDISQNCPLLTCKRVPWKSCIKELLWFIRGETDAKILQKQGVKIWDGNSSREFLDNRGLTDYDEGECGPIYGWQIRRSGAPYPDPEGGVDQLLYIENLLKTDPFSRRILWNLWIPSDLPKMSLTCCHYAFQLYVTKKDDQLYLSGMVNLRSNDLFLGNPFNIFSYYVLIRILCIRTKMKPLELILNIGDAHIYKNHMLQVKEQIERINRSLPVLNINPSVYGKNWEDIKIEDFSLVGYFPDTSIKAPMAV